MPNIGDLMLSIGDFENTIKALYSKKLVDNEMELEPSIRGDNSLKHILNVNNEDDDDDDFSVILTFGELQRLHALLGKYLSSYLNVGEKL